MFADSMLDTSWAQHSRRGWTTVTSFAIEAAIVAFLMIFQILTTVALPAARTISTPIVLGRLAEPSQHVHAQAAGPIPLVRYFDPRLLLPSHPRNPINGSEQAGIEPPQGLGAGDGFSLSSGGPNGAPLPFAGGTHPVMPVPAPATVTHTFRPSSLLEGSLIRRVQPVYPPLARSARIQGAVVLFAVISRDGTITNLHAVSGHPILIPAAVQAVEQWRYRPYILNNEPVEVETQITVNFVLGD
jgi:periplasmic protein TonB